MPGIEILVERHVERDETGLSVLVSFSPRDVVALEEVADLLAARLDVPPGISLRRRLVGRSWKPSCNAWPAGSWSLLWASW